MYIYLPSQLCRKLCTGNRNKFRFCHRTVIKRSAVNPHVYTINGNAISARFLNYPLTKKPTFIIWFPPQETSNRNSYGKANCLKSFYFSQHSAKKIKAETGKSVNIWTDSILFAAERLLMRMDLTLLQIRNRFEFCYQFSSPSKYRKANQL